MSDPIEAIGKITDILRSIRLLDLYIDGVEVTQSIQFRAADRHLTDPDDRGPDNSIQLVADKTALVRVYVRYPAGPVNGVVGSVTMQRSRWGLWADANQLPQLTPASISAWPNPNFANERGWLSQSLNFRIPAANMRGNFRLKVEINVPGRDLAASEFVYVNASLLQTLRIRGIPIRYDGRDANGNQLNLAAPTLADFQATAGTTLSMFPVSQTPDISLAGTFTWNQPLLGAIVGGRCPASWNNLLYWLGIARIIDGNRANVLYYGLFDPDMPIGGAAGCGGGGGVGAGASGDGMTMAHELGHILHFAHTPCGLSDDDTADPDYPAYEPYDTEAAKMASIGEYGVDLRGMRVHSPAISRDFMSYCGPRWISIYQMRRLINNPAFDPRILPGDPGSLPPVDWDRPRYIPELDLPRPPWEGRRTHLLDEPDPARLIVVTGIIERDRMEVAGVWRLLTGPTVSGRRIPDAYAETLDGHGEVLQRTALRLFRTHACGCGCHGGDDEESRSGLFQVMIPDSEDVSGIRIVKGDEEVWSRESPGEPPEISEVSAVLEDCQLRIRWHVTASDAYPLERAVQWSDDQGRHWKSLAIKLEDDTADVPIQGLLSGSILIRVLVSDGFNTRESEPVSVDIPRCPPTAAILWPRDGATVMTGEPLQLWGLGTASDGSALNPEDMQWVVDGRRAGSGTDLQASLQDYDGEHEVLLTVRDGDLSATARVVFNSTCGGHPAQRLSGTD
jgi:hypothetical protein